MRPLYARFSGPHKRSVPLLLCLSDACNWLISVTQQFPSLHHASRHVQYVPVLVTPPSLSHRPGPIGAKGGGIHTKREKACLDFWTALLPDLGTAGVTAIESCETLTMLSDCLSLIVGHAGLYLCSPRLCKVPSWASETHRRLHVTQTKAESHFQPVPSQATCILRELCQLIVNMPFSPTYVTSPHQTPCQHLLTYPCKVYPIYLFHYPSHSKN